MQPSHAGGELKAWAERWVTIFWGERLPYQRLFPRPPFQADGSPEAEPSSLTLPGSGEGRGQPHLPALPNLSVCFCRDCILLEKSWELPAGTKPQGEFWGHMVPSWGRWRVAGFEGVPCPGISRVPP